MSAPNISEFLRGDNHGRRWFATQYKEANTGGTYISGVYANSRAHAETLTEQRNLRELVIDSDLSAVPERRWILPSEAAVTLYKNFYSNKKFINIGRFARSEAREHAEFNKLNESLMHGSVFIGFLALKAGVATPDEVLSDQGIVHLATHVTCGVLDDIHSSMLGEMFRLTNVLPDIESRIPWSGLKPNIQTNSEKHRKTGGVDNSLFFIYAIVNPWEIGAVVKIRLSQLAIDEICYKLDIVQCGQDLLEDYNISDENVALLLDRLKKPGLYELSEKEAEVISGELNNSCDGDIDAGWKRAYRHVISQIKRGGAFNHELNKAPRAKRKQKYSRPKNSKGRSYPVNSVVEEMCGKIESMAKELIVRYEARTREVGRVPVKITDRKIKYFATKQHAGRAYYNHNGERLVTIPVQVFKEQITKPGYATYYVAHELAHHYANFKHKTIGHGAMFMFWLKQICPAEYVHYELEYKPKFARAAGIRINNQ